MKKMDSIGVAGSIGDFERVFEDMDVKTEEMNGALDNMYQASIDNSEVTNLLNEIKAQQGMAVGAGMVAGEGQISAQKDQEAADIQARLNQLNNL